MGGVAKKRVTWEELPWEEVTYVGVTEAERESPKKKQVLGMKELKR